MTNKPTNVKREELLKKLKITKKEGTSVIYAKHDEKILVDANLYDSLNDISWYITASGYAAHSNVTMHSLLALLFNFNKKCVDHINRNKLDNRIINLRPATRYENSRNISKSQNTKYKYKGIHLTASGKYQAMIWYNKKNHCIGSFTTQEEAAIAYNKEAIKIFGEFAHLNTIK